MSGGICPGGICPDTRQIMVNIDCIYLNKSKTITLLRESYH